MQGSTVVGHAARRHYTSSGPKSRIELLPEPPDPSLPPFRNVLLLLVGRCQRENDLPCDVAYESYTKARRKRSHDTYFLKNGRKWLTALMFVNTFDNDSMR